MKKIVNCAFDAGVICVSVYAFSTENRNRPDDEKEALFELIEEYFADSINELIEKHVKISFMGDLTYFSFKLQHIFQDAINRSAAFEGKTFNIGLNYGSQNEIVQAALKAIDLKEHLSEKTFSSLLYTANLPELDLIVRTGGEQRLSNFMLYQAAYSELFFTKTLWPDFSKKELFGILEEFSSRERRFGGV